MKSIIPNIAVQNCKEAIEFYKGIFGGELKNLKLADGIEMFKGHEGKVIHSELHINDDCVIYLTDIFNGKGETGNIQLVLELDSEEEINRVYSALKENGSVGYELQKTFWGAYHATLTDRFGNSWGLNYTVR
jgi:PhnB protein